MRSFYVPPKYSAPLTRGFFTPLDFLPSFPLFLPCAASVLTQRGIALRLTADSRSITKYFLRASRYRSAYYWGTPSYYTARSYYYGARSYYGAPYFYGGPSYFGRRYWW
jgi:hypothetical protein